MQRRLAIVAGLVALVWASTAQAQDSASINAGRGVAQRYCASCHAVADGRSPLSDAPPFARLHRRYGAGGLAELLETGMIADWPFPLEEGARPMHPRMPASPLTQDEVVALADYLRSFEPQHDHRSR